jgi:hypothetical protein
LAVSFCCETSVVKDHGEANRLIGGVDGRALNPAWQSAGRRRLDRADGTSAWRREHAAPAWPTEDCRQRFLTRMALSVGAQGLRSIDGFEARSTTARRLCAAALGCV